MSTENSSVHVLSGPGVSSILTGIVHKKNVVVTTGKASNNCKIFFLEYLTKRF